MFTLAKTSITILLLSSFAFSNSVMAKECYEQSPNLASAADEYYNLDDTVKLSNNEKNQLKDFFQGMRGRWEGELTYSECRGPDRAPSIITKRATITAKTILASSEQVSISAKKYYTVASVKKRENFTLFNVKNIYAVDFSKKNTLIFSERYRRQNNYIANDKSANKKPLVAQAKKYKSPTQVKATSQIAKSRTSRITETIYEVTLNANRLTLLRSYYANGVYTGEEKWSMRTN